MRWLLVKLLTRFWDYKSSSAGVDRQTKDYLFRRGRPGDIILARTRGTMLAVGFPGKWHSVGMFVDRGKIVTAMNGSLVREEAHDWLQAFDQCVVIRPRVAKGSERMVASAVMESLVGADGYDLPWHRDVDGLWAAEAISYAYREAMGDRFPVGPRRRSGRVTVLPSDLQDAFESRDKFAEV